MSSLTPAAAAFLRDASPDDLASLLAHLLAQRGIERVDLTDEDSGHRVAYLEVVPGVCVYVDMEKDVVVGVCRASRAEVRSQLLEMFGGYRLGRAPGFGLGARPYDYVP